ncbi:hypothetical protein MKK54_01790 [Methylobacterium sp. J-068]|nr:hypothetical protein [Methylobacterium sp. J-068]
MITVLFTGLVRDAEKTREKVGIVKRWKEEGVIDNFVFSTWIGALNEAPDIRAELESMDAYIVETQEPKVRWLGWFINQMKSLHYGLMACPDDHFVLKIRSDKLELTDAIKTFLLDFRNGTIDKATTPLPGWPRDLLQYRIFAPSLVPSLPFFYTDFCYFGYKPDLLSLIKLDVSYDYLFPRLNPEQVLFSTPFLTKIPLMFQYFRINPGLMHGQEDLAKDLSLYLSQSPIYQKIVLTSLLINQSYFTIGLESRRPDIESPERLRFSDLFSLDQSPHASMAFIPGSNAVQINSSAPIAAILANIRNGIDPTISAEDLRFCESWDNQSTYDFQTIGYTDEVRTHLDEYERRLGTPFIFPGTTYGERSAVLPTWELKVGSY